MDSRDSIEEMESLWGISHGDGLSVKKFVHEKGRKRNLQMKHI